MCVLLVPVALGVLVEGGEHDGEDLSGVVADQTHDVLVIPVIQSSLCHLNTQQSPSTPPWDSDSG